MESIPYIPRGKPSPLRGEALRKRLSAHDLSTLEADLGCSRRSAIDAVVKLYQLGLIAVCFTVEGDREYLDVRLNG